MNNHVNSIYITIFYEFFYNLMELYLARYYHQILTKHATHIRTISSITYITYDFYLSGICPLIAL